MVWISKCR